MAGLRFKPGAGLIACRLGEGTGRYQLAAHRAIKSGILMPRPRRFAATGELQDDMSKRVTETFFAVSTVGRFQGGKLANLLLSDANRWGGIKRAKRFASKAEAELARDAKARTSTLELTVVQVTLQ